LNRSKLAAILLVSVFVLALVPLTNFAPTTVRAYNINTQTFQSTGPLPDSLVYKIYTDPTAEYLGLKAGDIDVMDWGISATQISHAMAQETDGVLNLSTQADAGWFYMGVNCQATQYPLNDTLFRVFLAHLVNKTAVVTTGLGGYAWALNSLVPKHYWPYWNNATADSITPTFSEALANDTLRAAGYTYVGGSCSGYTYTGGHWEDKNGNHILDGSGGTTGPARTLGILTRSDDPGRKLGGELLYAELQKFGFTVSNTEGTSALIAPQVYIPSPTYDIATLGWGSMGPDPTYLWDFFNSESPYVNNFVYMNNATYDYWSNLVVTASDQATVKKACDMCQMILAQQCPYIGLYQRQLITGARTTWKGWVDMVGLGWENFYSLMQAHPASASYGGTMNVGLENPIQSLNPVTAQWVWDWDVLNMIYDSPLARNPIDNTWQPWAAQNATISIVPLPTASHPHENGTEIDYTMRSNVTWTDGVPVTSADLAFSMEWLNMAGPLPGLPGCVGVQAPRWQLPFNIVNVTCPDSMHAKVFLNSTTYFATGYSNFILLPKHVWQRFTSYAQVINLRSEQFGLDIGSGPFVFQTYVPGEYCQLKANTNYFREMSGRPAIPLGAVTTVAQGSPATLNIGKILNNATGPDVYGNEIDNATIAADVYGAQFIESLGGAFNPATSTYSIQLDTTNLTVDTYSVLATAVWQLIIPGTNAQVFQGYRPTWAVWNSSTPPNEVDTVRIPLSDLKLAVIIYDGTNDLLWNSNPAGMNEANMYGHLDFGCYVNANTFFGGHTSGTNTMTLYECAEPQLEYNTTTGRQTTVTIALASSVFTVSVWTGNLTNGGSYGLAFFLMPINATTGNDMAPIEMWLGGAYNVGAGWVVSWPYTTVARSYSFSVAVVAPAPWYTTGVGLFAVGAAVVAVVVAVGLGYSLIRARKGHAAE